MKQELINRLLSVFSQEFLEELSESIIRAFEDAKEFIEGRFSHLPEETALGQMRHMLCEEALYGVAKKHGLDVNFNDTNPKGGKYAFCHKDGIYLLRSNIQNHCGVPRRTKFRKQIAKCNAWLGPIQYSFLDNVSPPSDDNLCTMLVTSAFKENQGNPFIPAYIGIGIPNDNLSDWVIEIPLKELISLFQNNQAYDNDKTLSQDDRLNTMLDDEGNIKDIAYPKLKKVEKKGQKEE